MVGGGRTLTASRPLLATTVVCPRADSSLAATFWFMALSSTNNTDAEHRGVGAGIRAKDACWLALREGFFSGSEVGKVQGEQSGEVRGETVGSELVTDDDPNMLDGG